MNAITLQNVTKHFRKQTVRREYTSLKTELVRLLTLQRKWFAPPANIEALKGIDLTVPQGKTVGLVGRNGSGKSTLLKLITGIYSPTSGNLTVNGRISALLDLGAGFHPDFTGRENILINGIILGMSRAQVKARMDDIIAFAELGDFIDEPVRTYSSGMYMRLAFAVATHVDPEILIVDEILAVGDEHFSKKSLAKMNDFKKAGKTILLVTHDLNTVQSWCDLAAWIDGGRIRMYGSPAEVVSSYREAVALAEKQAVETGVSALSAPGLALPQLTTPSPAPESPLQISLIEWTPVDRPGEQRIDAQHGSLLRITVQSTGPRVPFGIQVRLCAEDGTVVFSSQTRLTQPLLPKEEGEPITFSQTLPGLGLRAGNYRLTVTVVGENGQALKEVSVEPVVVENACQGEGLIQLPVPWHVESTKAPALNLR